MRPDNAVNLTLIPLELVEANEIVQRYHRHHFPVIGHRFSIGVAKDDGELVGAAICGRPVARLVSKRLVLEITRLVTDGTPNACSMLYAACARIARSMGYQRIQTFILENEPGTSLIASGWEYSVGESGGGSWTRESKPNRRQDQPLGPKARWSRELNPTPSFQDSIRLPVGDEPDRQLALGC